MLGGTLVEMYVNYVLVGRCYAVTRQCFAEKCSFGHVSKVYIECKGF